MKETNIGQALAVSEIIGVSITKLHGFQEECWCKFSLVLWARSPGIEPGRAAGMQRVLFFFKEQSRNKC